MDISNANNNENRKPRRGRLPFQSGNGLTIKLKIEPDDKRHVLTCYINGADDAKNAVDNIQ